MKIYTLLVSSLISVNSYAGIPFEQACSMYPNATLKENVKITNLYSTSVSGFSSTFKVGDVNYSIHKDNIENYEIAKMAYLLRLTVNICVRKTTLNPKIDELIGIETRT
ncbi:Uncharacterised protein [Serratia ficaria]|nr:Uncharacterised protein [Serratia ficaria]CAI1541811.1 Uncharacterised protein [Serratia ficaria]